jgi:hypothetical protein
MSFDGFRIAFPRSDFLALAGPVPMALLTTALIALPLASPIVDIRSLPGGGVSVEWESLISAADRTLVINAVSIFTGGTTTSQPFTLTNAGPILASNNTPILVIDFTTPALDAGTYQAIWLSQHRLTAPASSTASRAVVLVNGVPQQDHWPHEVVRAYNGAATFQRSTGQTIQVQLAIAKLGPGAVQAEMTGARFILDRLS